MCDGKPFGVDAPGSAALWAAAGVLSDGGLADVLRRALREARRWDARQTELIAEAERRGLARREGFGSTTAWLAAVWGEPAPICRSQIAVAAALGGMPETRKAFAAGVLSALRVKLLAQAQALAPEQFASDEATLVAQAAAAPFGKLPGVLAAWKRSTDPAAAVEVEAERLHALRGLHLSGDWSGMLRVSGLLDPESGGVVQAAIRALSEPAALDPQDTRTTGQRQADALVEICHRHLDGKPGSGRSRPHLNVTVPWETLKEGSGVVDTDSGPISVQAARRLACDATVSGVVVEDGVPVAAGEARRVVSPALRRALDLRDKGCTHPECDMPGPVV